MDTNRVGCAVDELLIVGDSLLVTTEWGTSSSSEHSVHILSIAGDSIDQIGPPSLSYEYGQTYPNPGLMDCMETFRVIRQRGIGLTGNGDLLMTEPTLVVRRSLFGADSVWSTSIITLPCHKPCYVEDALELPNSDVLVAGYSVVDTIDVDGCPDLACTWRFKPWVGRLNGSTGELIDSLTIGCPSGIGCDLHSCWNFDGTGLAGLIGTSDGGFVLIYKRATNRLIIKVTAELETAWTRQGDLTWGNGNGFAKAVELDDHSLVIVYGDGGEYPQGGTIVEQLDNNGEVLCTMNVDTSMADYAWYGDGNENLIFVETQGAVLNANAKLFVILNANQGSGACLTLELPCTWQSTADQVLDAGATIYPQPCSNLLTVRTTVACAAELMDATGRTLMKTRSLQNQQELNLADFPNGIYIVKLLDRSGGVSSRRVIVQR